MGKYRASPRESRLLAGGSGEWRGGRCGDTGAPGHHLVPAAIHIDHSLPGLTIPYGTLVYLTRPHLNVPYRPEPWLVVPTGYGPWGQDSRPCTCPRPQHHRLHFIFKKLKTILLPHVFVKVVQLGHKIFETFELFYQLIIES